MMNAHLLQQFQQNREHYAQFQERLEQLLEELLHKHQIHYHTIAGRVKELGSLETKLVRGNGKYTKLPEITDLVGLRLVTYFADDVDHIAAFIEEEFAIDADRSVDKRKVLDADQFGYLSLHYVIELSEAQLQHEENQAFAGMKAEIQVRSILQHAWAEIEHDLGYKAKDKVPRDIRRSFSRIAGLLETADLEFIQIRDRLHNFEAELLEQIREQPQSVPLTSMAVRLLLQHEAVTQLDEALQLPGPQDDAAVQRLHQQLKWLQVATVADILTLLARPEALQLLQKEMQWEAGSCLELLCLYIAGKSCSAEKVEAYFTFFGLLKEAVRGEEAERLVRLVDGMERSAGEW